MVSVVDGPGFHVDESLTLEQIDGRSWGNPPADATRLIKTVYALRHKPVGTMETEDLRVLLLQQESLDVLVPVALTRLSLNPLAEGDFYPGDLLVAVLKTPSSYWQAHPDEQIRATQVVEAVGMLGNLDDHDAPHETIRSQIDAFRAAR